MTNIYLNGKVAYRRENDVITRCKKSDFVSLLKNRRSATIIIPKQLVKKYDLMLQKARFYMTDIEEYNNFEFKLVYKAF